MFIKILSFLYVFLFISSMAHANGIEYKIEPVSKTEYNKLILYPENGLWIVEKYNFQKNKIQSKVSRKVFINKPPFSTSLSFQKRPFISNTTSELPDKNIWQHEREWNLNWEAKYSQWISEKVNKNFFVNNNIATDCADVIIALRWIFSRIHKLPAAHSLAASGTLFSNLSIKSSWAHLPRHQEWRQDLLFLKSLNFLLNNTYTRSLLNDSYPIALNSKYLNEGAYWMSLNSSSGHAVLIHRTLKDNIPLHSLSSTVPQKVRPLIESIFIPEQVLKASQGGLLKVRWPQVNTRTAYLTSKNDMPGYSNEQYKILPAAKKSFAYTVLTTLSSEFDALRVYEGFIYSIIEQFKQRVEIIKKGALICKNNSCKPGTSLYEFWSTPSRDQRIKTDLVKAENLSIELGQIDKKIFKSKIKLYNKKRITVHKKKYTLKQLNIIWSKKYYNSQPWVDAKIRWGLEPAAFLYNLKIKMKKSLDDRDLIINNNLCRSSTSCASINKIWMDQSGLQINQTIQSYFHDMLNYCDWFQLNCYEFFNKYLAIFKIKRFNFYELASQAFFASFDPNSTDNERKGIWTNLQSKITFQPDYIGESKNYLVIKDLNGFTITDINKQYTYTRPTLGKIHFISQNQDYLIYQKENKIFKYEISNGESLFLLKIQNKKVNLNFFEHNDHLMILSSYFFTDLKMSPFHFDIVFAHSFSSLVTPHFFNPLINESSNVVLVYFQKQQPYLLSYDLNFQKFFTHKLFVNSEKNFQYKLSNYTGSYLKINQLNLLTQKSNSILINTTNGKTDVTNITSPQNLNSQWLKGTDLYLSTESNSAKAPQSYLYLINPPFSPRLVFNCSNCQINNFMNNQNLILIHHPQGITSYYNFNGNQLDLIIRDKKPLISSNGVYFLKRNSKLQHIDILDFDLKPLATFYKNSKINTSSKSLIVSLNLKNDRFSQIYRTKTYFDLKNNKILPIVSLPQKEFQPVQEGQPQVQSINNNYVQLGKISLWFKYL